VASRLAGVVALVLLVGRGLTLAQDVTTYEVGKVLPFEPAAQALVDQLGDEVPTRPVLVRGRGIAGLPEAVVDELDRRGAPVRLDEELGYKWGEHRVATPESVSSVWYVVQQGVMVSLLTDLEGASVLARLTPLDAGAEREALELQRRIADQLRRTGREDRVGALDTSLVEFVLSDEPGLDRAALAQLARLNERVERSGTCRCAIVAAPPDEPALDDLPLA
jgi:hypothetical protein